jgi:hypothetical protein
MTPHHRSVEVVLTWVIIGLILSIVAGSVAYFWVTEILPEFQRIERTLGRTQ